MAVTNGSTSSIQTFRKYNDAKGAYASLPASPKFVIVGDNEYLYSTDGISWTRNTSITGYHFVYKRYDGKYAMVMGGEQRVSDDGITWGSASGFRPPYSFYSGGYWADPSGNLYLLSGANNTFLQTVGGFTVAPNGDGRSVAASNEWVVFSGSSDSGTLRYANIATGATGSISSSGSNQAFAISFGGGMWHCSFGNTIHYKNSSDPTGTWTAGPTLSDFWMKPKFAGNGMWAIMNSSQSSPVNYFATSTNGISFTTRTLPFSAAWDIAYGAGVWVVVGTGGGIASSADGITWTLRASGASNTLRSVMFG